MRCLTLHQPWASLVPPGVKTWETRGWATKHRGQLVICASKQRPGVVRGVLGSHATIRPGGATDAYYHPVGRPAVRLPYPWPAGVALAVVDLTACLRIYAANRCPNDPGEFIEDAHTTGGPRLWHCRRRPDNGIDNLNPIGEDQRPYGDWTPGRYAWRLENIRALPEPPPVRGRQGIWTPSYPEFQAISEQIERIAA